MLDVEPFTFFASDLSYKNFQMAWKLPNSSWTPITFILKLRKSNLTYVNTWPRRIDYQRQISCYFLFSWKKQNNYRLSIPFQYQFDQWNFELQQLKAPIIYHNYRHTRINTGNCIQWKITHNNVIWHRNNANLAYY